MNEFKINHIQLNENFDEYKNNLIPEYLAYFLKSSKFIHKNRMQNVIRMKQSETFNVEDLHATYEFNRMANSLIGTFQQQIRFYGKFIENTESSVHPETIKEERIYFIKGTIMKLHRIIAIMKSPIIEI
ncbi:hypothetical protein [Pseudomonas simiae]|uniref:hypothetical protein n=1 Tax=Pseudomonas simiae TaxID=321846 RepID=UPI0011B1EEF5|nr:hypothetical protein [Pseudomonas simiae]